jgi:hypothetical protein
MLDEMQAGVPKTNMDNILKKANSKEQVPYSNLFHA